MRIGINVPNDLLKRIAPFKDVTNISQICRDAIQTYVEAYERAKSQANEDGTQEVADRLWREYKGQEVNWEALGYEDAKLWVQLASLQDFTDLFHNLKIDEREGKSPPSFIPVGRYIPGTKTHWDHQDEYKEWFIRQIELDVKTNPYLEAGSRYNHAWLCYVTAVWQMVKERIAADAQTREEGHIETLANTKLPAHLTNS